MGISKVTSTVTTTTAMILALNWSLPTFAKQEESSTSMIEEVIVTAEKRAESAQDLPIAISTFSGQNLLKSGVEGISDLQQLTPSLQFGEQTSTTFVSIRGIGSETSNIGAEAGVTIAQDGVPFSNQFMFNADFLDVERVEVLRGPQGTINGRNATGGAINIYSKQPTENVEGEITATLGNYNRVKTEGVLSGPLWGKALLGRLAVRADRADGWLINKALNEDQQSRDNLEARASLLATISDTVEAHLILEGGSDKSLKNSAIEAGRVRPDTPSYVEFYNEVGSDPENLEFYAGFPADYKSDRHKALLKVTWDVATSTRVSVITGYLRHKTEMSFDNDGSIVDVAEFPSTIIDLDQFSQEFTLTSDITDRMDLILGTLYLRANAKEPLSLGLPVFGLPTGSIVLRPEQNLTSYSGYTQVRYQATDHMRLSAGIRYTHDTKDYFEDQIILGALATPAGVPASASWGAWTPKFSVDYAPTDDLTVYASISRGFKAGGFNTYANPVDEFAPEFVWNYEAGLKGYWMDRRLRTELVGFYMDYVDLQQSLLRPGAAGGIPAPNVENASAATISGIELEIEALLTERLRIVAATTWLDATYDQLQSFDTIYPELGDRDLSGNQITRAPEWQFSFSAEYTVPVADWIEGVLRADYRWQDRIFYSFFNHDLNSQDSYGVLNLYGALETLDGHWQLSVFVNNALDERYFANKAAFAGLTPVPGQTGTLGTPRLFGLGVAYRF